MDNETLDRFMAEEVMGWHTGDKELDMPWDVVAEHWWIDKDDIYINFVSDWHPTTDIAQVMECAEKLDKEGMDYEIMSDRYSKEVRVWSPSKNLWFRKGWKSIADLPRNICLAFYEAMKGGE